MYVYASVCVCSCVLEWKLTARFTLHIVTVRGGQHCQFLVNWTEKGSVGGNGAVIRAVSAVCFRRTIKLKPQAVGPVRPKSSDCHTIQPKLTS